MLTQSNAKIILAFLVVMPPSLGDAAETTADRRAEHCRGGVFEEAYIPGGTVKIFEIPATGDRSNSAAVSVQVPAFCMMIDEVSASQFAECIEGGFCEAPDLPDPPDSKPVTWVSHLDTQDFIRWTEHLSEIEYRLPSESEWQRAAMGASQDEFPWRTIYREHNLNIFTDDIVEVGTTDVNQQGVRDMIGNVAEWVDDCYTIDVNDIPRDGTPHTTNTCSEGLVKGGFYSAPAFLLSPTFRAAFRREYSAAEVGFRLVRSIPGDH